MIARMLEWCAQALLWFVITHPAVATVLFAPFVFVYWLARPPKG